MQSKLVALAAGSVLPLLLSGCGGEPEWKSVYAQCKSQAQSAVAEANNASHPGEDARTKAMRESMNQAALSMALTACEMIRASCEHDPKGDTCRAIVENSKQ